jgi:hypothetical protein
MLAFYSRIAGDKVKKVNSKFRIVLWAGFLAGFGHIVPVAGQEGHPMDGSWVGDWGLNSQDRHRVVIIMEWDISGLVGTINPGNEAIPFDTAVANPDDWSLYAEAEGVDAEGRPVTYIIEGAIDDLGTYNRTIAGTWMVGSNTGDFSITRQ